MNEHKVRLIADEASAQCRKQFHGTPPAWEWEYKFAELIVKECITELEASIQCDPYNGETYDNEVNDVLTSQIDNLKEHFGV